MVENFSSLLSPSFLPCAQKTNAIKIKICVTPKMYTYVGVLSHSQQTKTLAVYLNVVAVCGFHDNLLQLHGCGKRGKLHQTTKLNGLVHLGHLSKQMSLLVSSCPSHILPVFLFSLESFPLPSVSLPGSPLKFPFHAPAIPTTGSTPSSFSSFPCSSSPLSLFLFHALYIFPSLSLSPPLPSHPPPPHPPSPPTCLISRTRVVLLRGSTYWLNVSWSVSPSRMGTTFLHNSRGLNSNSRRW